MVSGEFQEKIVYPDIFVNDAALRQVGKQNYLGVVFDSKFSWTHQVLNVEILCHYTPNTLI